MDGEDNFAGMETITNGHSEDLMPGDFGFYLLEFGLEKHIRNCEKVSRMTPCMEAFLDEKYGTRFNTSFEKLNSKSYNNMHGLETISK